MTARITSIVIITLAAINLSRTADAGSPFGDVQKFVKQAERIMGGGGSHHVQPRPCPKPTPHPTPAPYPTPCPTPTPYPQPGPVVNPNPAPQPYPSSYFLGVYTTTVAVDRGGAVPSGPQVRVVPGYGEQVYGQRIDRIVANSPAFHAGLEPGDTIINANGYAMDNREQLQAAIDNSRGYLEMQVLDGRTSQIVWVVAETQAQGGGPLVTRTQTGFNGSSRMAQPSGSTSSFTRSSAATNSMSAPQGTGGRRAPVRRR